jgi:hypothetical protein
MIPTGQPFKIHYTKDIEPLGAFEFLISPYNDPIRPNETVEIHGYHKLRGNNFQQQFPLLFILSWQYTTFELESKPEWVNIDIREDRFLTPLDGIEHNMSFFVSVTNDAPGYQYGTIKFKITTGKLWSRLFELQTYQIDQQIQVNAAFVPGLIVEDPPIKTFPPKTLEEIPLNITNIGNAQSILQFNVNYEEIPYGWNVQIPKPLFLDVDEMISTNITVYTPFTDDFIDEWVTFNLKIIVKAVVDPSCPSMNYTLPITVHCYG